MWEGAELARATQMSSSLTDSIAELKKFTPKG